MRSGKKQLKISDYKNILVFSKAPVFTASKTSATDKRTLDLADEEINYTVLERSNMASFGLLVFG